MAINPIQLNTDKFQANLSFGQKKDYKSYLEANGTVTTENNVKPLPPQGHLVDDNLVSGTKYFFKDIAYDMKSVKNGYKGTANDHQLGRLNDVGLKLGGIGIATYLASRTTNTKARIMEYVGLATFLTAMSIYPKIAINAPAKLVHGYDIDKEYIDDQGRKKSVQQDSNYVPYDMYQGKRKDENLDIIGDRMGIPRNIKNRHDVIKEQMRKIATQNNTLWMLTAGFATPLMTALICCGLENYVVAPAVAKAKNDKANNQIKDILEKLQAMATKDAAPQESKVSRTIAEIIKDYNAQELPKEEFENIVKILTDGLSTSTADVVKEELNILLNPQSDKKLDITKVTGKVFAKFRNANVKNNLNISTDEFNEALAKAKSMSSDTSKLEANLRMTLKEVFDKKITAANLSGAELRTHQSAANSLIQELSAGIGKFSGSVITESTIAKLNDFAKIIGEFKEKKVLLDSVENFKFEFAPETILARSSAKFERVLLKDLGINYKDLKKMRDSASYTEKILNERLMLLSKDDAKFKKLMTDLKDVFCENESNLNGASKDSPVIKELINSYEYLFNGTAKRLKKLGGFDKTVARLIGENSVSTDLWVNSKEELVRFLDGTTEAIKEGDSYKMIEKFSRGLGSDKYNAIERIFARYQNCTNGFRKVMHAADAYRKIFYDKTLLDSLSSKNPEYVKKVIDKCVETLLNGDPAAHFNKLNITEDSVLYRDVMKVLYSINDKSEVIVSNLTDDVLKSNEDFLKRFKDYIMKFRAIICNDKTDFTKPHHNFGETADYSRMAQTNKAKSDLIGEKLTEAVRKAAGRKYSTQKWVRIVGGALSGVLSATLLTQFCFGKIRNPHNLKKQVNNESN